MIDEIIANLTVFNILTGAVVLIALKALYARLRFEIKVRRLGGHPPRIRSWAPGNIDFLVSAIQHAARHENLQFWDSQFMKYGNKNNPYTVSTISVGQPIIFTADPENIKAVLATQFNDFGKGYRFHLDFEEFLGDSIFNVDHDLWHQSRQLIRPQFIKDRVSDLETFENHSQILLNLLGGKGQVVDVKDLFFRYTLDAATDFLLGRSVGSLENGEVAFSEAFGEIQRIQNIISRAGPLNFLVSRKEFRKHLKTLNDFVEPYIDDTLRLSPAELEKHTKGNAGYTFLHALAGYTRDRKVLRDQLVAVLLAGRDTTACTLAWLIYELSKNPKFYQELRDEIEQQVGLERAPTYADLKSMKLLQHTMNETLRLYPVVPFNVRVALKDTTLPHGGGPDGNQPVGVLKDTPIGYSTHYMQMCQDIYPPASEKFTHPLIWDPHRWETWQPKPWTFIPFNGGPRLCVGQQFALTEMGYTVTRILQRFSRLECRIPPKNGSMGMTEATAPRYGRDLSEKGYVGGALNMAGIAGVGGIGKSSVREMTDSRQMKYKSEIVLQPLEAVDVAFFE